MCIKEAYVNTVCEYGHSMSGDGHKYRCEDKCNAMQYNAV